MHQSIKNFKQIPQTIRYTEYIGDATIKNSSQSIAEPHRNRSTFQSELMSNDTRKKSKQTNGKSTMAHTNPQPVIFPYTVYAVSEKKTTRHILYNTTMSMCQPP